MIALLNRPVFSCSVFAAVPRRLFLGSVAASALCLVALSFLFYTLPPRYDSYFFGLNAPGAHQFQAHFGLNAIRPLPFRRFSQAFRVLIVLLWASYALVVAACLRGGGPAARPLAWLIALVAVAVAVGMPPLLSTDCYANASHGRLFVLYGQNPYLFGPEALAHGHDPVAHYLTWDAPTIYGPLWTWIEIGVVALLRHGSLWTQIVALKLVEAGALTATALAGRSLTARLAPGWENVTLAALGLNPMLLLEGPGMGHNDLVCLALLLLGGVLFYDKKLVFAVLCLGLSIAIKPVTLALLPWALLEYGRGRPWRQALPGLLAALLLALLPLVLLFAPLWSGPQTLASAQLRTNYGQDAGTLAHAAAVHGWLTARGAGPGLASALTSLAQNWLLALLYAALTLWLWRRPQPGGWLLAWAFFSLAVMFLFLKPAFPWYITWFWPICLLRWNRLYLSLSAGCFALSLLMTFGYGYLSSIGSRPPQYWIKISPVRHGSPVSFTPKI